MVAIQRYENALLACYTRGDLQWEGCNKTSHPRLIAALTTPIADSDERGNFDNDTASLLIPK